MKTLSQFPGLIGRLLAADQERRERRARWQIRRRRLAWRLQWLCDGAVRWVVLPLIKLLIAVIIVLALLGTGLAVFTR